MPSSDDTGSSSTTSDLPPTTTPPGDTTAFETTTGGSSEDGSTGDPPQAPDTAIDVTPAGLMTCCDAAAFQIAGYATIENTAAVPVGFAVAPGGQQYEVPAGASVRYPVPRFNCSPQPISLTFATNPPKVAELQIVDACPDATMDPAGDATGGSPAIDILEVRTGVTTDGDGFVAVITDGAWPLPDPEYSFHGSVELRSGGAPTVVCVIGREDGIDSRDCTTGNPMVVWTPLPNGFQATFAGVPFDEAFVELGHAPTIMDPIFIDDATAPLTVANPAVPPVPVPACSPFAVPEDPFFGPAFFGGTDPSCPAGLSCYLGLTGPACGTAGGGGPGLAAGETCTFLDDCAEGLSCTRPTTDPAGWTIGMLGETVCASVCDPCDAAACTAPAACEDTPQYWSNVFSLPGWTVPGAMGTCVDGGLPGGSVPFDPSGC